MFTADNLQRLMVIVMGLVVCLAAITIAARARRADYSETARVSFNVFIGIALFALGAGGVAYGVFGKQVLQFLGFAV